MSLVKLKTQVPEELGRVTVVKVVHTPGYSILEESRILLVETDKGLHWVECPLDGIIREPQPAIGDRLDGKDKVIVNLEADVPFTSAEVDFTFQFTDETPDEIEDAIEIELAGSSSPAELAALAEQSPEKVVMEDIKRRQAQRALEENPNGTLPGAILVVLFGGIAATLGAYAPKVLWGGATSGLWALIPIAGILLAVTLKRGILTRVTFAVVFGLCFLVNPLRGFEEHLPRWMKGSDILGKVTADLEPIIDERDGQVMTADQKHDGIQVMGKSWDNEASNSNRSVLLVEISNRTNSLLKAIEIDPLKSGTWRPVSFDPPVFPLEAVTIAVNIPLSEDGKPLETKGHPDDKRWHTGGTLHRDADLRPFDRTATFAQEGRSWVFGN
jgi:hypothetical protein